MIHLFITLVLQKVSVEIACRRDLDLLQVISHLSCIPECCDVPLYLNEPVVCHEGSGTPLPLNQPMDNIGIVSGMGLRMYL
ncbi:MAG: hypothetical protein ACI32N_02755 [Bulleidia sp.]